MSTRHKGDPTPTSSLFPSKKSGWGQRSSRGENEQFFVNVEEIKGLCGGVHRYSAQANPQIDDEISKKGRFRTGTSLDHVILDSSTDSFHMRLGVTVAVLAHVVLFIANWPSFARSAPQAPEQQLPIVVLRHFEYVIPPTPPPEVPWRRPAEIIHVPDPTPHDPEPIREVSALVPEFPLGDWVPSEGLSVPPPPPQVEEPVVPRVGAEITAPRRIVTVDPHYPEIARKARKEGAVILSLIIGPSGRVESVDVLRAQPLGLTEAAVDAAKQWVFEPSTYNGRPTAVQYILTVHFNLS